MAQLLCIMHQFGSMLCIRCSMMCIRHQYGLIIDNWDSETLRLRSLNDLWFDAVYQSPIWLNMAQWCVSGIILAQYGSMLCRHQFMAQCCASGITIQLKTVHHVSIWLDAVHPWLNLCIMHQYGSIIMIHCWFRDVICVLRWQCTRTGRSCYSYVHCSMMVVKYTVS